MQALLLTIHILACLVLIGLVLLQSGKEGMGVIFGGGSQSLFGSTGAGSMLVKMTAAVAAVFLLTSLTYNVVAGNRTKGAESIMDIQMETQQQDAPQAPAPAEQPKQ